MTIRVSAAEWNALTSRLAAAEKKLAAAERAEKSRLARNLKERCRHLLVGKTGSPRRKWYDSATESMRNARIEEILIEVGIKEAPKEETLEETLVQGEVAVEWDTDDETPDLPTTVKIPPMKSEDVADYLSDNYGWCVNNWNLVQDRGELSDEE
tara:strand:- start:46 stop:507 length:462 start_codon:yes stop_codon:yes gene_type:complete